MLYISVNWQALPHRYRANAVAAGSTSLHEITATAAMLKDDALMQT